jgi:hypothetical protein
MAGECGTAKLLTSWWPGKKRKKKGLRSWYPL